MFIKAHINTYILFFLIIIIGAILRLYNLTSVPRGLHGDELGVGYNAYTLLKTGKDEYGKILPLVFRTDFTPLIFYATIPSIALLGLNELAIRFPTAFIGIATIPAVYFLVIELLKNTNIALLTMFGISISSWHIRTSRIALELTWALFFQIIATVLFLRSLNTKKTLYLPASFFFFALSLFSYHSSKLTTPILIIGLTFFYRKLVIKNKLILKISILFFINVALPLLIYFNVQPLLKTRFVGINVITSWKNTLKPDSFPTLLQFSNLLKTIVHNYLIHFDPKLLFFDNSRLRYFQLENHGLFYLWQLPFILIGLFLIYTYRRIQLYKFIIFWLLVSPLAAAFTTGVPFANIGRVLMMLPIIELISAIGLFIVLKKFSKHIFLKMLIFVFLFICINLNLLNTFKDYFTNQPSKFATFWGNYYKQAIYSMLPYENLVDKIIVSNKNPQSYMYLLFYGKKDPLWLFSQDREQSLLIGYNRIGKYEFRTIDWEKDKLLKNTLLIGTAQEIPKTANSLIKEINSSQDEIILRIVMTPFE